MDYPSDVLVSVLVPTHRDLELLGRALPTLAAPGVEIVIVNNDPSQDVQAWASERFPDARVIDMGFDAGYPRAMNAAIAESRGEFVLFIDSDVFLAKSYIPELIRFLTDHPCAGCAGGKLRRYDLTGDHETDLLDTAGIRLGRNRRPMARGEGERDVGQYDQAEQTFGVDGAGMLVRRAALDSIVIDGEYFDSSFFMHKEDTDLCWRIRLAGWQTWYVPAAVGTHGRTTRGLGSRGYLASIRAVRRNENAKRADVRIHAMKNQWLMLTKNEDAHNFIRDLPFIFGRECAVFFYNCLFAPRTLIAVREYVRLIRPTIRKRHAIKSRQIVSAKELRRWLGN